MRTARAAVFVGPGRDLQLQSFPCPEARGSEILVRVEGCTICGSDLHTIHGRRAVAAPMILGHEIVGLIEAFGPEAPRVDIAGADLNVGDRVTWCVVANCNACPACIDGLPQKCREGRKYGHQPLQPGEWLGGLAEYCLLVRGTRVVQLPKSLPLAVACPASCATATVAAVLSVAGEVSARTVCVFGAGALGLTACAMAASAGAKYVVCADINPARLGLARRFGAHHAVEPAEVDKLARELTAGRGADAAFELSGAPAAFESAIPLLRTGGKLVLAGAVFPTPAVPLLMEQVVRGCLTIRGVHNYAPRDLQVAVEFLNKAKEWPFASLVDSWYMLEDVNSAVARAADPGVIRVGVKMSDD